MNIFLALLLPEAVLLKRLYSLLFLGTRMRNKQFDLEAELSFIVGQNEIKSQLRELHALMKIDSMRRKRKLQIETHSMHMIFSGNPGTGKTTIARIVGRIMRETGILRSGHIVETDRSGLVGQYVGQTAIKTTEKIKEALGGILFIDEAYSLLSDPHSNDFGREAVDTIVKAMEDNRNDLIVIMAGYPNEMQKLMKSNPGLHSRFPLQIDFNDYTPEEAFKIGLESIWQRGYTMTKPAQDMFYKELVNIGQDIASLGNGRYIRNRIEMIIRKQAVRLAGSERRLKKEDLMQLREEDLL